MDSYCTLVPGLLFLHSQLPSADPTSVHFQLQQQCGLHVSGHGPGERGNPEGTLLHAAASLRISCWGLAASMFSALYPAHLLGTGVQMYHPGGAVGCGYGPVKPVENCPETYVFQLFSKKNLHQ